MTKTKKIITKKIIKKKIIKKRNTKKTGGYVLFRGDSSDDDDDTWIFNWVYTWLKRFFLRKKPSIADEKKIEKALDVLQSKPNMNSSEEAKLKALQVCLMFYKFKTQMMNTYNDRSIYMGKVCTKMVMKLRDINLYNSILIFYSQNYILFDQEIRNQMVDYRQILNDFQKMDFTVEEQICAEKIDTLINQIIEQLRFFRE